jgi:CheY-like chemotaxis protein
MNRILIVEDETIARRQLAEILRFENFEVAEAESGQGGIAAAIGAPPDLVICDITMPGTDGFGVLQALRNHPGTSLVPFIFLTAKAGSHDVREGMGLGADDYITKPYDPEALLSSARQRIARRRLQVEEAERRASETGMSAAAVLPREMEGCLTHIESISDMFVVKYGDDPQAAEMRTALKQEVTRLRTLSQRLSLYGELPRLYAGRFSLAPTPSAHCSSEIALAVARTIAGQWARSSDLEITDASTLVPLTASALSVFTRELVDNACKFSVSSTPVVIELRSEPAFWTLKVTNRGPGILPEQIRNIGAFKQFWSGSERPTGLGLGLVLVQALARLHSGEVLIESEPQGNGTRVTVMIPSE